MRYKVKSQHIRITPNNKLSSGRVNTLIHEPGQTRFARRPVRRKRELDNDLSLSFRVPANAFRTPWDYADNPIDESPGNGVFQFDNSFGFVDLDFPTGPMGINHWGVGGFQSELFGFSDYGQNYDLNYCVNDCWNLTEPILVEPVALSSWHSRTAAAIVSMNECNNDYYNDTYHNDNPEIKGVVAMAWDALKEFFSFLRAHR